MPTPEQKSQPLALYNPALLPPELLLAEFTARRPLLNSLVEVIRQNAPAKPLQHGLLVGARGMGKTTTLWAVAYTIRRDPELSRQWLPVVFDEESRRVGDLADFWLEALRQWEHAANDSEDRAGHLLDKADASIEDAARNSFLEKVDRSGRRALLLIDNLNDLLASIHDPEPLHRLRAFLMDDPRVMVLGTATRYLDQITDLDQPLYDFFRVFELRPLTLDEMRASLLALAEARGDKSVPKTLEERSGTVQGLYLLTGGNPRRIKTFYRLLTEGLRGDIRTDLERLLDEFTPYFKAVVDALPVQQQRIFDAVALAWDPVEVAAVSRVTRLPSNQVSAQLRALGKAGLICETAGSPKRKMYLLADRFSNIHYLMRHGRAARNRFDWFVALVRLVFPDTQAETLAKLARQTAECGADGLRDARDLLRSALSRADSDDSRQEILHAAFREMWNAETLSSLASWLDLEEARRHLPEASVVEFFSRMPMNLRRKLKYAPESPDWWLALGGVLHQERADSLAAAACRKAIKLDRAYSPAWVDLGISLKGLGARVEAENAYRRAIELDREAPTPWNNLGNLLRDSGRGTESEAAYRKAIDLDPKRATPWCNLGTVLKDLGRTLEAEAAYRRALELDPKYTTPLNNLGNLLKDLGRDGEAESAYRRAIELAPKYATPWNNLGNLLKGSNRNAEAEAAYRKAIELAPKYATAWNNLGILLKDAGRDKEAEFAYRKAIELDPKYAMPWGNLGNMLEDLGHRAEAEAAYLKAIELDPRYATPWFALGNLLKDLDRNAEAEAAYRKAIELDPKCAMAWNNLGNLLKDSGRAAGAEASYRKAIEFDAKYATPWNNLGTLLHDQGRIPEAEAAYRKAIGIDVRHVTAWFNLGNLLNGSARTKEAEASYRKAIELNPEHAASWNNFADLLARSNRTAEAEAAYRKAIEIDPVLAYARSGLANVLAGRPVSLTEARNSAATGLKLHPEYGFARQTFARVCQSEANAWQTVLPDLASWCATNPKNAQVFDFTVDGFLQYARLTKPADAMALLKALPDPSPFETLMDAFHAHADQEHLNRLAPERRALVIELLSRLSETETPAIEERPQK